MEIYSKVVKVDTAGAAGAAVGSKNLGGLRGFLLDVYIDYHASAPGTTDVAVAYRRQGGTIVTVSNNKTDKLVAPRRQVQGSDGNDLAGEYEQYPIDQDLTISVAQADALSPCVTVTVRMLGF